MTPRETIWRAIMNDADFEEYDPLDACPSCGRRADAILAALTAAGWALVKRRTLLSIAEDCDNGCAADALFALQFIPAEGETR